MWSNLVHINNQKPGHKKVQHPLIYYYTSAIVTSTSTPGSMVMDVICFTTSEGLCRSITRLCTRNSNLSHVLVPKHKQHNIINVIHQKAKWKSWVCVLGAKNSTNKEKMKPHMWIKDVTCADIEVQIKEQPSASTTTTASSVERNSSVCNHKKEKPVAFTFSTRRLASGYVQHLGWHPHWSLHFEPLILSALDQVCTHCHRFQRRINRSCST